jgi:hypothetical protein
MPSKFSPQALALMIITGLVLMPEAASAAATPNAAVTYSPPDMTDVSAAQLRKYYAWRDRMDWVLAPIHSRADLDAYLKAKTNSDSPLNALAPDARRRFLASLKFGRSGVGGFSTADLQYLSAVQVYRILALFGMQAYTPDIVPIPTRPVAPQTAGARPGKVTAVQKRFDAWWDFVQRSGGNFGSNGAAAAREYQKLFAADQTPQKIRGAGVEDLRLLLRAAAQAASATEDVRSGRDAMLDLDELERRRAAAPPDYRQAYEALMVTKQFAAARKLYQAQPVVAPSPPPEFRDEAGGVAPGTPTVLKVSTERREVIRRPVDLSGPARVVILTDPACHFCAYFLDALQSRPQLRRRLEQHALWIAPPSGVFDFDTLQQWNRAHPAERIDIMYRLQEWPMVKDLAVPTFYFLQNGSLVTTVVGWPRSGNFEKLQVALKKIGLP